MFSATSQKILRNWQWVFCINPFPLATPENTTVDAITQKVYPVEREKTELIIKLITEGNWKQILVLPNKTRC
jgi:ATP-dependent RNA helicase RhlE